MRKLRLFLLFGFLFVLCASSIILYIRIPKYTVQTSGRLIIVNKLSKSITVFDLMKGEEITEFSLPVEPHEAVALSNKNRFVITNYGAPNIIGKSISIINGATYKIEKTIELEDSPRPHGIARLGSTNKVVVATDVGNEVLVVNTDLGRVETKVATHQYWSHMVVLHPKKPIAYVSNITSGTVSIINIDSGKNVNVIACGLGTEGIDITPDGKELWVSNSRENTISVIDTESQKITHTLTTGNEALRLKFSIDGKYCLVPNSKDGTIRVYNQQTKRQSKLIRIPGKKNILERLMYHTPRPVGILMHPEGSYAFVANSNADKIEVIDMKSLEIVSSIPAGRVPDGLAFLEQ